MFTKLSALAMRVAALYAALDLSAQISARHLMAALRVIEFSTRSAEWALEAGHPLAARLLAMLEAAKHLGMTRTNIRDALKNNGVRREVNAALEWLHERGLAEGRMYKTAGTVRPVEVWFATRFAPAEVRPEQQH